MSAEDDVKSVEERMEKRRDLIARRFEDVKLEVSSVAAKAAKSWPVLAVAGGLAAGYAISRGMRQRPSFPAVQYVPVRTANAESQARRKGFLAAILGIAATAVKIGASSEARVFVNAIKRFRDRRRYG